MQDPACIVSTHFLGAKWWASQGEEPIHAPCFPSTCKSRVRFVAVKELGTLYAGLKLISQACLIRLLQCPISKRKLSFSMSVPKRKLSFSISVPLSLQSLGHGLASETSRACPREECSSCLRYAGVVLPEAALPTRVSSLSYTA